MEIKSDVIRKRKMDGGHTQVTLADLDTIYSSTHNNKTRIRGLTATVSY